MQIRPLPTKTINTAKFLKHHAKFLKCEDSGYGFETETGLDFRESAAALLQIERNGLKPPAAWKLSGMAEALRIQRWAQLNAGIGPDVAAEMLAALQAK